MKAVIFDLDQTLVYTLRRFFEVLNRLLRDYGEKELEWSVFVKYYADDALDEFVPKSISREVFWRIFLKRYNELFSPLDSPIPGAIEVLRALKRRGFKVAVVTGRAVDELEVWRELRMYGMEAYVDCIVTGKNFLDGELFSKKRILRRAAELLGVSIEECVVVGDYWADIISGKEVGAKLVVGVLTGLMPAEKLVKCGADVVIESVADLLEILNV
ncbi:MAG: HAD family hydrolase [Candidatus Methanomethylicota archaeon]|nr:HAD family hydrolase [Candidatus Culexmicrobium cathedralense]RLE48951.1 MAG: HAD family hydrolase [Candidatus Verstraetearchaeota archaeon]